MRWRWMWWPSDVCVLNKYVSWIDARRGRCVNLKVWLFSCSDGGQDAPVHLSSNANNCWRVSYGTQVLEGPTRTKLYIGICRTLWKSTWHKNVISCMLPDIYSSMHVRLLNIKLSCPVLHMCPDLHIECFVGTRTPLRKMEEYPSITSPIRVFLKKKKDLKTWLEVEKTLIGSKKFKRDSLMYSTMQKRLRTAICRVL